MNILEFLYYVKKARKLYCGLRSLKIIFTWTTMLDIAFSPLKRVTGARWTIISGLWIIAEPVSVLNTTSTRFATRCPLCPRSPHSINCRKRKLLAVEKKAFSWYEVKVISYRQGWISRSMQLRNIPVAAFSNTNLFLIEFPWNETPVGVPWPITRNQLTWLRLWTGTAFLSSQKKRCTNNRSVC